MPKPEKLGCSKALLGLVMPTGYTFDADGTSLYMTLAGLFVAHATNTRLSFMPQLTILGIALLTSKGAQEALFMSAPEMCSAVEAEGESGKPDF
jgi:aerobic C4-dicarboxylate transport protein